MLTWATGQGPLFDFNTLFFAVEVNVLAVGSALFTVFLCVLFTAEVLVQESNITGSVNLTVSWARASGRTTTETRALGLAFVFVFLAFSDTTSITVTGLNAVV